MSQSTFDKLVVARIWESIQPIDRGERYEDPLQEALEQKGLGEVTGGGTQLGEKGEIEFADVEIMLADLNGAVEFTRIALEGLGAPAGSELLIEGPDGEKSIPFGVAQGVGIYLDGINLPQEVYEQSDLNDLAGQLTAALQKHGGGEIRGCWSGAEETALYIYGKDADAIYTAIEPVLNSYPLCQNARVVVNIGNPKLARRALRVARRE